LLDKVSPLAMTEFLNAHRLRRWAIIPVGMMALWVVMAATEAILNLNSVRIHLGADFTCFWAAGSLARHGLAASVYQAQILDAAEHTVRTMPPGGILPFYYPPPYLLLCLVLACMPYWTAIFVFLSGSATLLFTALWRLVPREFGIFPILAFPGFLITARTGQNGLLSAACLAWFAVLADRRPWLAGACLGALAYKPQLAICVPFALLASGRWRSLAGAAATYAVLCTASLILFGPGVWVAFFRHANEARATIDGGMLEPSKIMSTFVAARLLGLGLRGAAVLQGLVSLSAVAALIWYARRRPDGVALGGALSAACLLVTPYATDYDLVCLAPALAAGVARGVRSGFLPGDKLFLIAAFLLPLVAVYIVQFSGTQIAPVVIAGLLFVLLRAPANAPDTMPPSPKPTPR